VSLPGVRWTNKPGDYRPRRHSEARPNLDFKWVLGLTDPHFDCRHEQGLNLFREALSGIAAEPPIV
jgi:hypothetical protein